MLICDGFGTHETLEILEFCFESNIILCRIPSHTSHKLQPCNIAVFGPLKTAYRGQVERLERGGVNTIGKEHFTSLYSPARKRALTEKNIRAGWAKNGLFPFNPDRVLRDIPKPVAALTVPKACEVDVGPCPQGKVVQTPMTPVTPVTTKTLMPLQDLINQDTHALDEMSKRRLQRHIQKLVNAAQISFAKRALQRDQIRFLSKVNNEAKVRRSTKSVVLGKAKVMSYEDLEEARAKRAAKEQAMAGKGKRGRKRKNLAAEAAEADAPEAKAPVARMI
jgi:DDE superfamily endonuclease